MCPIKQNVASGLELHPYHDELRCQEKLISRERHHAHV